MLGILTLWPPAPSFSYGQGERQGPLHIPATGHSPATSIFSWKSLERVSLVAGAPPLLSPTAKGRGLTVLWRAGPQGSAPSASRAPVRSPSWGSAWAGLQDGSAHPTSLTFVPSTF